MVRAKFRCDRNDSNGDGSTISLVPVTSGSEENERFFHLTPGGGVHMITVNAQAAAQFEVGKEYYVDFSRADEDMVTVPASAIAPVSDEPNQDWD